MNPHYYLPAPPDSLLIYLPPKVMPLLFLKTNTLSPVSVAPMYMGAGPPAGTWAHNLRSHNRWRMSLSSQQLSASTIPQLGRRPCDLFASIHAGLFSGLILCIVLLHEYFSIMKNKGTVIWLMSNKQCLCCFHIKVFAQRYAVIFCLWSSKVCLQIRVQS